MNFKMSFLATVSVALFAVSANAQIIHESDFEAESITGFGVSVETMLFNDCGGDLIGFEGNGNAETTGLSMGVTANNPRSGSFAYAVDVGVTNGTGNMGAPNGWGSAWCGANTENGTGGFTNQAAAEENGNGCYVDFSAGATFTTSCWMATDPLNPLTGSASGEIRLEFNHVNADGQIADIIPRQVSALLGAAELTAEYQQVTISYTLTQADVDAGIAAGTPINSISAVMGIDGAGHESSTGHILFDDFAFEVNPENVVVVGDGHAAAEPDVLKGDVDRNGSVEFADIPEFIAVLQSGNLQAEADCDCSGGVDFSDIPVFIMILQTQ